MIIHEAVFVLTLVLVFAFGFYAGAHLVIVIMAIWLNREGFKPIIDRQGRRRIVRKEYKG